MEKIYIQIWGTKLVCSSDFRLRGIKLPVGEATGSTVPTARIGIRPLCFYDYSSPA